MRKLALLATAAIALTTPAHAEMKEFHRSGAWGVMAGINNGNIPQCATTTALPDSRTVVIKYNNTDGLFVELYKNGWIIPKGTKIEIEIGFDNESFGATKSGYGGQSQYNRGLVGTGIQSPSIESFLDKFAEADRMWFKLGGSEPVWIVGLAGSREAKDAFVRCRAKVMLSAPTQPYAKETTPAPSTTQPYEKPKAIKPETFNPRDRRA